MAQRSVHGERGDGDNYTGETGLSALSDVIGNPKRLPKEWINEDGVSLNFQFFRYATPLIQGEVAVPCGNGLPAYAKLAKESVNKTLPAYEGWAKPGHCEKRSNLPAGRPAKQSNWIAISLRRGYGRQAVRRTGLAMTNNS